MILFSEFGEPPQFAIWLENCKDGTLNTVFVTHRTASNDWEGKTDCPDSLPLWHSIFMSDFVPQAEDSDGKSPFHAVTGATPVEGHFKIRAEVEPGSEWYCWIEVNLAGDFNESYPYFNDSADFIDTHHMGQPGLVYRAKLQAETGKTFRPKLYGMSVLSPVKKEILRPVEGITTAKDIFEEILVRVIRPKIKLIEKETQ